METSVMGRVTTAATIENLQDLGDVDRGMLTADKVRRVVVEDALVETGATMLSLPSRLIAQLGLKRMFTKNVVTSAGIGQADVYEVARLTIRDRFCNLDVMEVPDTVPAIIGQIPLEQLDFVVDLRSRSLIGNPAHGGEHVIEAF
jgi:predicted aspartyl protease